jgi:hypothetical protein
MDGKNFCLKIRSYKKLAIFLEHSFKTYTESTKKKPNLSHWAESEMK